MASSFLSLRRGANNTALRRAGRESAISRDAGPVTIMASELATQLGRRIRELRKALLYTQEELAERAGLSVRGVSDLERGAKVRPHRETVQHQQPACMASAVDR